MIFVSSSCRVLDLVLLCEEWLSDYVVGGIPFRDCGVLHKVNSLDKRVIS